MDFWTAIVLIVLIEAVSRIFRSRGAGDGVKASRLAAQEAEIQRLQQQVTEMRESTTRYDISFDTALQRLERRIGDIEAAKGPVQDRIHTGL